MWDSNIRRIVSLLALCCMSSLLALATSASADQSLGAEGAEDLVRQLWFEGLPLEEAARLDAEGAARLAEMLADPAEAAHHANILMALAGSSHAGAYEAIARWAVLPRTGEVDRDTFRAWQVLPHALGTLSKRDGRALDLLESQLESQPAGWRFRHHDADQVAQLTRRAAATGLARSGLPRAEALLRAAEQRATDAAFRRHLRKARDLHQRRREGVAR